MNWIDWLTTPSVVGAPTSVIAGAVTGLLAVAVSAGLKTWQDRDMFRPDMEIAREIRREAREQRKAFGANRVGKGAPAGGQFAVHDRSDAEVGLED